MVVPMLSYPFIYFSQTLALYFVSTAVQCGYFIPVFLVCFFF